MTEKQKIKIRRIEGFLGEGWHWLVTCSVCLHLCATRDTWPRALSKAKMHAWLRHHVEL